VDPKHTLTVLNRLADRASKQTSQIEKALSGRLEDLAFTALRVAAETEGPLGRTLAREIHKGCDLELAVDLMSLCTGIDYQFSVAL
jgi:hypothetical protein